MITCKSVNTGGLGRFGNQMFSIASTIGIAVKNGQPYGFPEWVNRDNALFGGTADSMGQYFVNQLPPLIDGINYQDIPYHWEYRDYNIPQGSWNICSHLQDPRYFEHCMPLIRETFRMKDEIVDDREFIALHYRAGDYIDNPNAYHPRQAMEYYLKAMDLFTPQERRNIIVYSDDFNAACDMFEPILGYGKVTHHHHYTDAFKSMKSCKHFITANSSFSYMAALLGERPDKRIIMPKMWFGKSAGINFDGYCKDAVVI